jgi:hypothetical protein
MAGRLFVFVLCSMHSAYWGSYITWLKWHIHTKLRQKYKIVMNRLVKFSVLSHWNCMELESSSMIYARNSFFLHIQELSSLSLYELNPWHIFPEEFIPTQFVNESGARRFISLPLYSLLIQLIQAQTFIPHFLRSILILSHINLLLPSGLFNWDFPIKILHALFILRLRSIFLAHLILLEFITLPMLCEEYKLWSSPLCNFLRAPVTYCLLPTDIPLSTLFSNTLNLCSSLWLRYFHSCIEYVHVTAAYCGPQVTPITGC